MLNLFKKSKDQKNVIIKNSSISELCRIDEFTKCLKVELGYASIISRNCNLRGPIKIGRYCQIGPGVKMFARDHPYKTISIYVNKNLFEGRRKQLLKALPITIGNDVLIGANAVILKGVKIGSGAVIGAGTIVMDDVPPYAIYVGNPGKIVKYRFDDEMIDLLLNSKWWMLNTNELEEHEELFKRDFTENNLETKELLQKFCLKFQK
jgi:acetyltransferase-like isoleucine patch superfamily enzyme